MKVLAIGQDIRLQELEEKLGEEVEFHGANSYEFEEDVQDFDVIFDLNLDDFGLFTVLPVYEQFSGLLIGGAVKQSLAEMVAEMPQDEELPFVLAGMNTLPGFINRNVAELSLYNMQDQEGVEEIINSLGWKPLVVNDRVGMVTPRILFMIINEAFLTLQEGTATAKDIDASMKLGTNYPMGPFEWAMQIGLDQVFETLEALYHDTHDMRFIPAPLMKSSYLRGEMPSPA